MNPILQQLTIIMRKIDGGTVPPIDWESRPSQYVSQIFTNEKIAGSSAFTQPDRAKKLQTQVCKSFLITDKE